MEPIKHNSAKPNEPLPLLHHPLAPACMDCRRPFETCWFRQWRCEACSLRSLVACTAYAEHQSGWEARQARKAEAELAARVAREQRAADDVLTGRLTWALLIAAGVLGCLCR